MCHVLCSLFFIWENGSWPTRRGTRIRAKISSQHALSHAIVLASFTRPCSIAMQSIHSHRTPLEPRSGVVYPSSRIIIVTLRAQETSLRIRQLLPRYRPPKKTNVVETPTNPDTAPPPPNLLPPSTQQARQEGTTTLTKSKMQQSDLKRARKPTKFKHTCS